MKVFFVILLAVFVIAFGAFFIPPAAMGQTQEREEATDIQRGQVTETEREYSKEYKKLYIYFKSGKLSELRGGNQDVGASLGLPNIPANPYAPAISTSEFLRNLSCKADAIVVGSVESKAAHLAEDETFIYTEYTFSVREIVKDNANAPIKVSKSIEITRPGGVIRLNNRRITFEDQSYQPLQKNKDYILFLRFLPSANGYVVASNEGDFMLENNSFKKLSKLSLPGVPDNNNSQDLLNALQKAVSEGCGKNS